MGISNRNIKGMGIKLEFGNKNEPMEWQGMRLKKIFPLVSNTDPTSDRTKSRRPDQLPLSWFSSSAYWPRPPPSPLLVVSGLLSLDTGLI